MPDSIAIQLNDTHPALTIVELMRLLVDEHGMSMGRQLAHHDAAYLQLHQSHAVARGAGDLAGVVVRALLPRHLQIIYQINRDFLQRGRARDFRTIWSAAAACR